MELDQIYKNIDDKAKSEIKLSQEFYDNIPEEDEEPASMPKPVDIYQQTQDRIYDVNQKSFPKGSSAIVNTAVNAVVDGMGAEGLARAYKRAKAESDALKNRGERGRAELLRKQYMDENFIPSVEIVINSTSPDEVLANTKALEELDEYVLLEGAGKGYTATYIRQAYGNQLGNVKGRSDDSVRSGVMRLNALLDDGQIRTAYGLATKLKEQIDNGEHISDDADYDLIGRVVSYYSV